MTYCVSSTLLFRWLYAHEFVKKLNETKTGLLALLLRPFFLFYSCIFPIIQVCSISLKHSRDNNFSLRKVKEISVDINRPSQLVVADCANQDSNRDRELIWGLEDRYVRWLIHGMWLAQGVLTILSLIALLFRLIHVQTQLLEHPELNILWNSADCCFTTAFKVILINSSSRSPALSCTHRQGIRQRKKTKHNKSLYYAKQQSWLIVSVATARLIVL